jgi:hypothetical protein
VGLKPHAIQSKSARSADCASLLRFDLASHVAGKPWDVNGGRGSECWFEVPRTGDFVCIAWDFRDCLTTRAAVRLVRTPRVKTRGYTRRSPPDGGLRRLIQIRNGHSRSVHFHGVNGEIRSDRRCTVRTKCGLRYCVASGFNPRRRSGTTNAPQL